MRLIAEPHRSDIRFDGHEIFAGIGVFACDQCNIPSVGIIELPHEHVSIDETKMYLNESNLTWLPPLNGSKEFPDVPERIAAAAGEAHRCASQGMLRGAVMLARAVIEATAKEKGITSSALNRKIDALGEAGHIRDHIRDQAHEVRHFGNDMAHGDFTMAVEKADVVECLVIMDATLDEVFQGPARTGRLTERRDARKRE